MVCVLFYCLVFFFKQKTAYEMRISDWSSDVCSSDLWLVRPASSDGGFLDVYGELRVRAETQRRARMTVAPDQRHLNIVGTLHGGFLMAIVDHALFAGPMALGIEDAAGGVTIDESVPFLAPAEDGRHLAAGVDDLDRRGVVRGKGLADGVEIGG